MCRACVSTRPLTKSAFGSTKKSGTRSFRRERSAEMPIVQAMASAAARLLGSPITSISCK